MKIEQIQPKKVTSADAKQVIAYYFSQTPSALEDAESDSELFKDVTNPKKWKRIEKYKPDEYNVPVAYEQDKPEWVTVFSAGQPTDLIQGDARVPFTHVVAARRFELNSDDADLSVLTVELTDGTTHICEINYD